MKLADVAKNAFAMPLTDPAYPRGPTNSTIGNSWSSATVPIPTRCARWCPNRLRWWAIQSTTSSSACRFDRLWRLYGNRPGHPVRFRMPDGTVQEGGYVHAMYLDDNSPIAGGREIWGFRKSSPNQRSRMRARPWSAPCTMVRFCACQPPWATNIANLTRRLC